MNNRLSVYLNYGHKSMLSWNKPLSMCATVSGYGHYLDLKGAKKEGFINSLSMERSISRSCLPSNHGVIGLTTLSVKLSDHAPNLPGFVPDRHWCTFTSWIFTGPPPLLLWVRPTTDDIFQMYCCSCLPWKGDGFHSPGSETPASDIFWRSGKRHVGLFGWAVICSRLILVLPSRQLKQSLRRWTIQDLLDKGLLFTIIKVYLAPFCFSYWFWLGDTRY